MTSLTCTPEEGEGRERERARERERERESREDNNGIIERMCVCEEGIHTWTNATVTTIVMACSKRTNIQVIVISWLV